MIRERRQLTQKALATAAAVPIASYQRLEKTGKSQRRHVARVALVLGLTATDLERIGAVDPLQAQATPELTKFFGDVMPDVDRIGHVLVEMADRWRGLKPLGIATLNPLMPRLPSTRLAGGIYEDAKGYSVVAVSGSRQTRRQREQRFPLGTPLATLQAWQDRTRRALEQLPRPDASAPRVGGTLADDAVVYLATVTHMPSYQGRRADLEAWLPAFGQRGRHSLSAVELAAELNRWAAAGYAASTLNHRRQALRAVYQLLDPGMPTPIDGTERVTPPPLEARALAWADVVELLAALPASKSGAMLKVMAQTGLPPARIVRLRPRDVNERDRTVFLSGRRKGQGTTSKTVRVTDAAVAALREHFTYFPEGGGVSGNAWYVVFTRTVGRVNAERARTGRQPLSPDLRPYDLRHSIGTEIYARTNDLQAAAAMLDVSLETAQRYTLGAVSGQIDKAVDAMNTGGVGYFSEGLGFPTHGIAARRKDANLRTNLQSSQSVPNPHFQPRLVKSRPENA